MKPIPLYSWNPRADLTIVADHTESYEDSYCAVAGRKWKEWMPHAIFASGALLSDGACRN